MKQDKILFVTNATTREALVYSLLYTGVFFRNIGRAINRIVHRLPWLFIILIAAIATITSFVCIGQARAERDKYNHRLTQAMQQLESYRAVYGDGKEVK